MDEEPIAIHAGDKLFFYHKTSFGVSILDSGYDPVFGLVRTASYEDACFAVTGYLIGCNQGAKAGEERAKDKIKRALGLL